jgi:multiple sugar transport system substrate-binding protein
MWIYKKAYEDAGVPIPSDETNLTYQQVADQAKQLAKKEGDRTLVFGYGADSAWTDRFWMNMLAEKKLTLYKDSFTKIDLTGNDEAKAVVKWYFDMAKDNLMANPLNPSPSWIGEDFNKGALAICQYGFWFGGMAETDVTKGQVVMLPTATWAGVPTDPTITATGYIITAATKVPDAAWKAFEWYMGDQPAKDRATSGWGVPALKSMYSMIPQKTDFDKQKFKILQRELALNTAPVQFNPFLSEGVVPNSWNKNLEQALSGKMTFEELLTAVETEVNAAITDGVMRIG